MNLLAPLLTHLLSNSFTDIEKALDPNQLAGTIRIVPVVNLPDTAANHGIFQMVET